MTLLRIIESTLPVALSGAFERHRLWCEGEGWRVEDVYLGKAGKDVAVGLGEVREVIEVWRAGLAPGSRPHVWLIGDLPVPRSGIGQNPDGHENTAGAYPCPAYYATDPRGWTDTRSNVRPAGQIQPRATYVNQPGDGAFDQDTLPQDAELAIGVLNLRPGASATWGFASNRTEWLGDAYERWFAAAHAWRRGAWRPQTTFGCARNSTAAPEIWLAQTDRQQRLYRPDTVEAAAPFGAFLDVKGLPANGNFWFQRSQPLAAVYLEYESYQTAYPCSRLVNSLMTGSVCAAPLGPMWDLTGWQVKTVGELWQQTARKGASPALALYGDPTFRIPTALETKNPNEPP